jgi:hypothetical protein
VESQKRLVVGCSARNCCLGLSIVSNCSVDENCTYFLVGSFFVSFFGSFSCGVGDFEEFFDFLCFLNESKHQFMWSATFCWIIDGNRVGAPSVCFCADLFTLNKGS